MTTKAIAKKVNNLSKEITLLRSVIFGIIGKDPEGSYKPAFVKAVLKAVERKPTEKFTTGKEFLKRLRRIA